ncbi:protein YLS3 [Eutrema salsugineum]|uniref:protein YLS3 n=1 Tax=Eutrema salsugineum TaxID=72664 RepID=UPI000CED1A77|nr:protein YLS3 [Eutrema salsugineum]
MASSTLFITLLISLSLTFLQVVLAQVPGTTATCASMLLSLAPCGPFVQGFVQLPAQPCCDGLNQVYSQDPTCLCLLLNNTSTLSPAFPINQTLALQLPPLCNMPASSSSCSSSPGT